MTELTDRVQGVKEISEVESKKFPEFGNRDIFQIYQDGINAFISAQIKYLKEEYLPQWSREQEKLPKLWLDAYLSYLKEEYPKLYRKRFRENLRESCGWASAKYRAWDKNV